MKKQLQKTFKIGLLSLLFLLGLLSQLQAQNAIKGKVTDAQTGEALPGVSVLVKGTTTGTTTNNAGEFSTKVANNNAILVFSFVGYAATEVVVGNQTTINIALSADNKSLDEVVVVADAYGRERKCREAIVMTIALRQTTMKIVEMRPMITRMTTMFLPHYTHDPKKPSCSIRHHR